MRIRTGHRPGDWIDGGASFARLQGFRGSLVVAPSSAKHSDPISAARLRGVARTKYGTDEERRIAKLAQRRANRRKVA